MFRIIPEKILLDNRLPDKAKFIMSDIISWRLSSLECFNTNETFAERFGISKKSVSRHISLLVELNYIERIIFYKKGTKRVEKNNVFIS
jgi:predicted HTH transcriptional regulator